RARIRFVAGKDTVEFAVVEITSERGIDEGKRSVVRDLVQGAVAAEVRAAGSRRDPVEEKIFRTRVEGGQDAAVGIERQPEQSAQSGRHGKVSEASAGRTWLIPHLPKIPEGDHVPPHAETHARKDNHRDRI